MVVKIGVGYYRRAKGKIVEKLESDLLFCLVAYNQFNDYADYNDYNKQN